MPEKWNIISSHSTMGRFHSQYLWVLHQPPSTVLGNGAITVCLRLQNAMVMWLTNRHLILKVLEAGKSKIKVLVCFVPSGGSLVDGGLFAVSSCGGERKRAVCLVSSYKDIKLIMRT